MNKLTRYSTFEEMKQDAAPIALPAAEKQRLETEAQQMAQTLQALRAKRPVGNARK